MTNSIDIIGQAGGSCTNSGLWGLAIVLACFVVRAIGVSLKGRKLQREEGEGVPRESLSEVTSADERWL